MTDTWPLLTDLKPFLQNNWEKSGFKAPTSIQSEAVPLLLAGKDVIAESPTGTGKTLAYLLPVLNKIDASKPQIQAVVLASSHELVMQIHAEMQNWTSGTEITTAAFIGGANVKRQLEKLKKHPQIITGTPGRLQELIKMKKLKMHEVKTIVLDEADQLLVPEHRETLENIIKSTLNERQLLLFSATLPEAVVQTAKQLMRDPEVIEVKQEQALPPVKHQYIVGEPRDKVDMLRKIARMDDVFGLAFMKDIGNLTVYAEKLHFNGLEIGVLHSDVNKQERAKVIKAFRTQEIPLLLATDVAARGLDIKEISHVIHVDLPMDESQYTHRSGRTGRLGGKAGTVISLVTEREERKLKQMTKKLGITVEKVEFSHGQLVTRETRGKANGKNSRFS